MDNPRRREQVRQDPQQELTDERWKWRKPGYSLYRDIEDRTGWDSGLVPRERYQKELDRLIETYPDAFTAVHYEDWSPIYVSHPVPDISEEPTEGKIRHNFLVMTDGGFLLFEEIVSSGLDAQDLERHLIGRRGLKEVLARVHQGMLPMNGPIPLVEINVDGIILQISALRFTEDPNNLNYGGAEILEEVCRRGDEAGRGLPKRTADVTAALRPYERVARRIYAAGHFYPDDPYHALKYQRGIEKLTEKYPKAYAPITLTTGETIYVGRAISLLEHFENEGSQFVLLTRGGFFTYMDLSPQSPVLVDRIDQFIRQNGGYEKLLEATVRILESPDSNLPRRIYYGFDTALGVDMIDPDSEELDNISQDAQRRGEKKNEQAEATSLSERNTNRELYRPATRVREMFERLDEEPLNKMDTYLERVRKSALYATQWWRTFTHAYGSLFRYNHEPNSNLYRDHKNPAVTGPDPFGKRWEKRDPFEPYFWTLTQSPTKWYRPSQQRMWEQVNSADTWWNPTQPQMFLPINEVNFDRLFQNKFADFLKENKIPTTREVAEIITKRLNGVGGVLTKDEKFIFTELAPFLPMRMQMSPDKVLRFLHTVSSKLDQTRFKGKITGYDPLTELLGAHLQLERIMPIIDELAANERYPNEYDQNGYSGYFILRNLLIYGAILFQRGNTAFARMRVVREVAAKVAEEMLAHDYSSTDNELGEIYKELYAEDSDKNKIYAYDPVKRKIVLASKKRK